MLKINIISNRINISRVAFPFLKISDPPRPPSVSNRMWNKLKDDQFQADIGERFLTVPFTNLVAVTNGFLCFTVSSLTIIKWFSIQSLNILVTVFFFSTGNYHDSLNDATSATELEPTFVKAIVRGTINIKHKTYNDISNKRSLLISPSTLINAPCNSFI